jgi:hypothetical protein
MRPIGGEPMTRHRLRAVTAPADAPRAAIVLQSGPTFEQGDSGTTLEEVEAPEEASVVKEESGPCQKKQR